MEHLYKLNVPIYLQKCNGCKSSHLSNMLRHNIFFQAIKAIVALDSAGIIMGWKFFDHAAHLGGAILGMYDYYHV